MTRSKIRPKEITAAVAVETKVLASDMRGKGRTKSLVWARHVAIWICREFDWTLAETGLFFRRHHTTVMHAQSSVESRIRRTDPDGAEARSLIERIMARLLESPVGASGSGGRFHGDSPSKPEKNSPQEGNPMRTFVVKFWPNKEVEVRARNPEYALASLIGEGGDWPGGIELTEQGWHFQAWVRKKK